MKNIVIVNRRFCEEWLSCSTFWTCSISSMETGISGRNVTEGSNMTLEIREYLSSKWTKQNIYVGIHLIITGYGTCLRVMALLATTTFWIQHYSAIVSFFLHHFHPHPFLLYLVCFHRQKQWCLWAAQYAESGRHGSGGNTWLASWLLHVGDIHGQWHLSLEECSIPTSWTCDQGFLSHLPGGTKISVNPDRSTRKPQRNHWGWQRRLESFPLHRQSLCA